MATPVATNIMMGPVILYKGPVGETVPADSVALGTAWGGNWERVGGTKSPLEASFAFDEVEAIIEEELTAVKRRRSSEALTLETELAELTSDYLALATSGTATTTAAGASQVGKDELDLGGSAVLDELAWGFEGTYTDSSGDSFPVRLFVWRATAQINGSLTFSKSQPGTGIPIQIKALVDLTQSAGEKLMKFQRVTAAATG